MLKFIIIASAFVSINSIAVEDYLSKFGYKDNGKSHFSGSSSTKEALLKLQKHFHLPMTGVVDAATLEIINTPRCGVSDFARFDDGPAKWNEDYLSYRITKGSIKMPLGAVRRIIKDAFNIWEKVLPILFYEVHPQSKSNISAMFGSGPHSDRCQKRGAFDGPSGVLAHAWFPKDGNVHFDDDEDWVEKNNDVEIKGIDLLRVAVHEIGHILGLGHDTSTRDAIMYSAYVYTSKGAALHENDIRRIQNLYGKSTIKACTDVRSDCSWQKQRDVDFCTKYMVDPICRKTCNLC